MRFSKAVVKYRITNQALPVDMNVSYALDGKSVSPEDLAGKSGNIPDLVDGVKQQRDGSKELSGGLDKFNRDGVQKLVSCMAQNFAGVKLATQPRLLNSTSYSMLSLTSARPPNGSYRLQ